MDNQNPTAPTTPPVSPTPVTQPVTPTTPPTQPTAPLEPTTAVTPPPSHNRMKLMTFGLIGVLLLAALAFGGYMFMQQGPEAPIILDPTPTSAVKACTEETRLCPDGSSVGRVGPICEFAACPVISATPSAAAKKATPSAVPPTKQGTRAATPITTN